jgi:hypothetical protein
MTRLRALFVACVLPLCFVALSGCSDRPQDGLDALLQATQRGDADAAWQCFDRASRAMLRDTAAMMRAEGQLEGSAKAHLIGGFVPQGIAAVDVVRREGDDAVLELTDFDGNKQQVSMRWEDDQWRLHLPGADPDAAATVALQ